MANKNDRNSGSVPGAFYVDSSCIDCDLCRVTAPATFRRNEEIGFSIVYSQPLTPDETALAEQALHDCPTESIGSDGV
jgi:ferredoxin